MGTFTAVNSIVHSTNGRLLEFSSLYVSRSFFLFKFMRKRWAWRGSCLCNSILLASRSILLPCWWKNSVPPMTKKKKKWRLCQSVCVSFLVLFTCTVHLLSRTYNSPVSAQALKAQCLGSRISRLMHLSNFELRGCASPMTFRGCRGLWSCYSCAFKEESPKLAPAVCRTIMHADTNCFQSTPL